jgi:hypothetical protein
MTRQYQSGAGIGEVPAVNVLIPEKFILHSFLRRASVLPPWSQKSRDEKEASIQEHEENHPI